MGVSALDYMDAYKKFTYVNQESYSLNHIAYVELEERKLDYSEVDTLHELYRTDFLKFIDYNEHDVVLVENLEKKIWIEENKSYTINIKLKTSPIYLKETRVTAEKRKGKIRVIK